MAYVPRRPAQSEFVELRGLRFHINRWPGSDPDPIVLLHGFQDAGRTFQFVVDHLPQTRELIAPDLRGFGQSQWGQPPSGYWFPDYLADLDELLDLLAPKQPVTLIGHSMGGNIASLYAGIRPERVRRLISLEGFGLKRTTPTDAPHRYRQWLTQQKSTHVYSTYDSFEALATMLMRRNARLTTERADFIARAWGMLCSDGRVNLRGDPAHKMVNPVLYRREEAEACWAAITAPILLVIGDNSNSEGWLGDDVADERLQACYPRAGVVRIREAGHMMHHEQPEAVAAHLERFIESN